MGICCGNVSSYKQDSVWSWFICFCTTICMMLTVGFTFALGVLLPVFMDSFEESRERAAWVSSITMGVSAFLGPIGGGLLNILGLRITITLSCLLCSVGLAAGSFAPNIVILYIAFSLPFALGLAFVYVTSTIVMTHYFTKRRSFALGLVTAGIGMGTMIIGPTLQALVDIFDWRNAFRVFAGILSLASLTGCLLHKRSTCPDEHQKAPSRKFRLNITLLKNPNILVRMTTIAVFTFSRMVPYVHLIKHCGDLGIPADKSSTLFLFIGIFNTLGRLSAGFLCDLKYINTIRLFQVATFIMGASTMLLTLAKTYAGLVVYVITFSVADGMMLSTFIIECLGSVEESKRASVIGFVGMAGAGFSLSSPPLSGLMADKFGNYIAAFLVAGGFGIIASLIPFLLLCFKRESEEIIDDDIEQIQDQAASEGIDIDIDEYELKPRSYSRDSTIMNRTDRQRSTSFIVSMENPFY